MVNGSIKVIGTSEYLKNHYGSGYRLSLTTTKPSEAKAWIEETFPNTRCINSFGENLTFDISKVGGTAQEVGLP